MQNIIVFLPILILAILESTIIPLHLVLLAIICWSVLRPGREGMLVAFFSGLILDFLEGKTLASSSILFLITSFLIYLYKNRFQAGRFAFLLPFTLFSLIVVDLLDGLPALSIRTVLIEGVNTVLIIFLFPIFNFLAKSFGEEQLKLKI
ncbi:rod shape-determining protein MreD [Candidatus Gottesmanbacteria bacterium]|nr:rod shape-determining protein MreD [Candidatus Gottesmanbacteria bacterium]